MTYSTWDSHVVPYRSTDQAQRCLTSQFGWDTVLSPWYDRKTRALSSNPTPVRKNQKLQKKSFFFFLLVFFSRGLEHCGPFIHQCHIKYRTKRWLLPKFDSKILIKWSNTGSASGASVHGPLVMDPHPAIGVSTQKFQKSRRISFFSFFFFFLT